MEIGKLAPDFSLLGSDGNIHKLSDYKGKKIMIYFYPKDNTPGCTTQACDIRDNYKKLTDENFIIFGISKDNLNSHNKFIEKFELPFILLSDEQKIVCNLYDVIKEKNMYGKKVLGIERSTFIIDENGILVNEFRKVNAKTHIELILESL